MLPQLHLVLLHLLLLLLLHLLLLLLLLHHLLLEKLLLCRPAVRGDRRLRALGHLVRPHDPERCTRRQPTRAAGLGCFQTQSYAPGSMPASSTTHRPLRPSEVFHVCSLS